MASPSLRAGLQSQESRCTFSPLTCRTCRPSRLPFSLPALVTVPLHCACITSSRSGQPHAEQRQQGESAPRLSFMVAKPYGAQSLKSSRYLQQPAHPEAPRVSQSWGPSENGCCQWIIPGGPPKRRPIFLRLFSLSTKSGPFRGLTSLSISPNNQLHRSKS
ncbi:hypothetical protein HDK77DRAFT_19750 [Phyllosticta capitalensis]